MAQLEWLGGYTGQPSGTLLHWVPPRASAAAADEPEVVYAAGSCIVAMRPSSRRQRCLQGHRTAVRALALAISDDGTDARLASAAEGLGAALRLWDLREGRCVATVPGAWSESPARGG